MALLLPSTVLLFMFSTDVDGSTDLYRRSLSVKMYTEGKGREVYTVYDADGHPSSH